MTSGGGSDRRTAGGFYRGEEKGFSLYLFTTNGSIIYKGVSEIIL
jgi:hypothetical protein